MTLDVETTNDAADHACHIVRRAELFVSGYVVSVVSCSKNNQLEMPIDVSSSSSISFLICLTTDTIMVNKDDNIENI